MLIELGFRIHFFIQKIDYFWDIIICQIHYSNKKINDFKEFKYAEFAFSGKNLKILDNYNMYIESDPEFNFLNKNLIIMGIKKKDKENLIIQIIVSI